MDAKLPPSPQQNSGILAIQIHQLSDLELPQRRRALEAIDKAIDTNTPSTYAQMVSQSMPKPIGAFLSDRPLVFER